jgi:hypothetical protein
MTFQLGNMFKVAGNASFSWITSASGNRASVLAAMPTPPPSLISLGTSVGGCDSGRLGGGGRCDSKGRFRRRVFCSLCKSGCLTCPEDGVLFLLDRPSPADSGPSSPVFAAVSVMNGAFVFGAIFIALHLDFRGPHNSRSNSVVQRWFRFRIGRHGLTIISAGCVRQQLCCRLSHVEHQKVVMACRGQTATLGCMDSSMCHHKPATQHCVTSQVAV